MKSKVILVALLAVALGLSAPGLALARGGMGGGFNGGNAMGGGFSGGGGFASDHQGIGTPAGQADRQQDHSAAQTRQQDQAHIQDRTQAGSPGVQAGDNGHHYGQVDGTPGQGATHRATSAQPAVPAQPATPGEPAIPAGN